MGAFEAVLQAIGAAMTETATPGVALALRTGDDVRTAGLGITSVENPLDVTPDTLFQIGSITKTFTATALMCLVERDALDLDAPVRTYLPELRLADESVAARVTTRHLLLHTAGWVGDHFADFGPGDDALARMIDSLAALPQLTPLGEVWSYCNSGFCLAGRVVEVVAGRPYEVAMRQLVLDPLGLENTFFSTDDVMTRRFAAGHLPGGDPDGAPRVARPWGLPRAQAPAGALSSTVGDLLRYARFHASGDDGVLRGASLAEMRSPQGRRDAADEEMGLAWFLSERDGRRVVSHTGATNGQAALLAFLLEEDTALAVLTNHQRGAGVGRAALDALGIGEPERIAIDLDPSEYLGVYTSALADVEVRHDDGSLVLALSYNAGFPTPDSPPLPSPPPAPVAFFARDRLFLTGGPMAGTEGDFLRGPDGSLRWLRYAGRIAARQRAS
ncbi:MAG: hypothetical protein QOH72_5221 [Solirubrobacteraceae bacterium]|nr:hypothetical protein [Solirubrobacteraceae bacterium]